MSLCLNQFQDRLGCAYCEADMLQVSMLVNVRDNEYYHLRAPAKSPGGREGMFERAGRISEACP